MAGNILRQELEGDETMQARVFGLVDHSHPAAAESLDDSVMRDHLADHLARILRDGGRQVNESRGMVEGVALSALPCRGCFVQVFPFRRARGHRSGYTRDSIVSIDGG